MLFCRKCCDPAHVVMLQSSKSMELIEDIEFSSARENLIGDFNLDLFLPGNLDINIIRKHVKTSAGQVVKQRRKNSKDTIGRQYEGETKLDEDLNDEYSGIIKDSLVSAEARHPINEYQISDGNQRSLTGKAPLVLFVHGGGWRRGGRLAWKHYLYYDVNFLVAILQWLINTYYNVGESLAQNGIACGLITYPLSELDFPYVLLEMFLSYIQCCFVTWLGLVPPSIFFYVLQTHVSNHSTWMSVEFGARHESKIIYGFMVLLVTNFIMLVLFTFKRNQFQLSLLHVAILWIVTGSTYVLLNLLLKQYQFIFHTLVTLALTQLVILRQRLSRCDITWSDQARVVARAVHWAKRLARKSGQIDREKIFLMGHSAGGHLTTLIVLDDFYLKGVHCSVQDIKGVISLSGVYDLDCLSSKLLKHTYHLPTFGENKPTWRKASPMYQVKKSKTVKRPKFLLMSAQVDPVLVPQSHAFSEKLKSFGVECNHVTVHGSNHFTIIRNLMRIFGKKDESVLKLIVDFIFQN